MVNWWVCAVSVNVCGGLERGGREKIRLLLMWIALGATLLGNSDWR